MKVTSRRNPCVARSQKEGKRAVRKIRRIVSMKMTIENNRRCNIPGVRKRLKRVSQKRRVDKTKSF